MDQIKALISSRISELQYKLGHLDAQAKEVEEKILMLKSELRAFNNVLIALDNETTK